MKRSWPTCFRSGAVKRPVAGLMLFLWLTVIALAVVPELHEFFHADAKDEHHQCAVTVVIQGQYLHTAPAVVSVAPLHAVPFTPAKFVSVLLPAVPYRLVPGRAPPAA